MKLTIQPLTIKGLTYQRTFELKISFQEDVTAEHERLGPASFGAMATYDYLPLAKAYAQKVIEALNLTVSSDLTSVAGVCIWVFRNDLTPGQCRKVVTPEPVAVFADGPVYNPLPKLSEIGKFLNKCRLWLVKHKPSKQAPAHTLNDRHPAERYRRGHHLQHREMDYYEPFGETAF